MMEEKTARKLTAALEANTHAQEEANKLTRAVLKASGRSVHSGGPIPPPGGSQGDVSASAFTGMYGGR